MEYHAHIVIRLKDHQDYFAQLHENLKASAPMSKIRAALDDAKLDYTLTDGPAENANTKKPRKASTPRIVPGRPASQSHPNGPDDAPGMV